MKRALCLSAICLLCHSLSAQDAASIVTESHILGFAPALEIRAEMRILGRGAMQRRTVQVYLQRSGDGSSRMLAQILEPPFLQSMKFLQHQNADGTQDRWLGSSRGVQRLSIGDYGQNLFNSDFTTDDFAYIDVSNLQAEVIDRSADITRIRVTDPAGSTRIMSVDEARHLIVGIDYLDDHGAVERRYTVTTTASTDGVWHPILAEMHDLVADTRTELTVLTLEPVAQIPARVFSRASL